MPMYRFVLLALVITFTAHAQFPSDHAVLVDQAAAIASTSRAALQAAGGRVAITTTNVWIVRVNRSHDAELARATGATVLRDAAAAMEYGREHPDFAWLPTLFPASGTGRVTAGEEGDATVHSLQHEHEGSCQSVDAPAEAADIRALMQLRPFAEQHGALSVDPNLTSDRMQGTSTVAIMYVNNVNAAQMGVPTWTDALRNGSFANIMVNLAWWSDQAAAYGYDKVFTLRPWWPENPACAITFDPTEGYTNTSFSINDHKFQNPIMDALGYAAGANQTVKMRAFCNDLRATEGTDWAWIVFLLTGKNTVRAHASFGGPSTVLMGTAASSGYVFAHETGHIYHGLDEYWEADFAIGRARQTRNGAPNGNFNFRNFPIMPCMMAYNFRALSGYTAVHLGLDSTVRFTRVQADPPSAIYAVEYLAPDGTRSGLTRYQGPLSFSWGRAARVLLRALPVITHEGMAWHTPTWDASGADSLLITVDEATPAVLTLRYAPTSTPRPLAMHYLTTGNALASEIVSDIRALDDRRIAFVGPKGISLVNGDSLTIIDVQIGDRGGPVFRESYAATAGDDGTLYFSSHAGEIVGWNGRPFVRKGPVADITYRSLDVDAAGTLWATDGGVIGGRDMQASGLHVFDATGVQVFTSGNSPLPSNAIVALAAAASGEVWIGFGGKLPSDQGLYRFTPTTSTIIDATSSIAYPMVAKLRRIGRDSLLVLSRSGTDIGSETAVSLLTPTGVRQWEASLFRQLGFVNDIALDRNGRLIVASTLGVSLLRSDDTWERIVVAQSEFMSNICQSLAVLPGGDLIVGTNVGAVRLHTTSATSSVRSPGVPHRAMIEGIWPQPLQQMLHLRLDVAQAGDLRVTLHDVLGRRVHDLHAAPLASGTHQLSLSIPGELPAGMYLLSVQRAGSIETARIQILR